ncbi:hypothetical protein V6N11_008059 [Hibiscus sabdariffa]|uniref:Uncharacterized protein n=1 Tax=Hibiscus sabdariffa TaxID=183260 RepID=A0ABR2PZZ1_9ROSI
MSNDSKKGGNNAAVASKDGSHFQVLQEVNMEDRVDSFQTEGMVTDNLVGVLHDVVPLIEGSPTEVHTHKVARIADNHKTISIVENSGKDRRAARSRASTSNSGKNRVLKENSMKTFKVRKGYTTHDANRVVLAEWIQFASNRIDIMASTMQRKSKQDDLGIEVDDAGGSLSLLEENDPIEVVGDAMIWLFEMGMVHHLLNGFLLDCLFH